MMKIAIMQADSNGGYPIPASKGGAVSTLVEHLIEDNSCSKCADLTIVSYYDEEAERISEKYNNVKFVWVKIPKIIKLLDQICFETFRICFKKKKLVSYKSLFSLLWYIRFGTKFLKKNLFDKLILENNIPLAIMIKKSNYKGEFYYHFHNVPRVHMGCRDVFNKCSGFLCVSNYVANQIKSEDSAIGKIAEEKIHVLYNCIDTNKFRAKFEEHVVIRNKYGLKNDDKVIVFVGRLSEEKGIDRIIEALKLIEDTSIKLLIVGSYMYNSNTKDPYSLYLHKIAKSLEDRIVFTGYIQQEELAEIYSASDIAVLPSMWDEPAGLTMIEALACEIPVITTESGGIPEYVNGNAIVLKRDANLVDEIKNSILNTLEKNIDVQNGRKKIEKEFSVKGYMSRCCKQINADF